MSRILITGAARGRLEPAIRQQGAPQMPDIERMYEAEVAERGARDASAPVGAGGAAAVR